MTTKEKLLELFESNKGIYFSGEEIAGKLCVSRAAVWKAVKNLRSEGYEIDAVTNKGYCLSAKTDILSAQGIGKYLNPQYKNMDIYVLDSIDSTNALVRKKAEEGEIEGYTVVANEQTKGRGRYGRTFFSPQGTGFYLSILLRPPHYSAGLAVRITTMAAVAMCEAIEEVSEEEARIKWVNDIYVDKKKVCGILTEASFGLEDGFLGYAVLGIGINVSPPVGGFPEEIAAIAGTVFSEEQSDGKNRLAAAFLNRFMRYYTSPRPADYVESYRNRSLVIGKEIEVISSEQVKKAVALDIDNDCRLIVQYESGQTDTLYSGQISIKVL